MTSGPGKPSAAPMAGVALGAGLCCGLPVLLGTSSGAAVLGLWVGSSLLMGTALVLGVWAFPLRRRRCRRGVAAHGDGDARRSGPDDAGLQPPTADPEAA